MFDRIEKARKDIEAAADLLGRPVNIMEVCGTHTVSIFRSGLRSILPKSLKMLSGPGCPVCVTHQGYIDNMLTLADRDDCIVATYGDMIRVPGTNGSLENRTETNVKVVLSSEEALELARKNPDKKVVFIAVGFETTTPATAVVLKEAAAQMVENFYVLANHKLVIPAMRALLSDTNNRIDAFLCPGHVSVIIGYEAYRPVAKEFGKPCVVGGFEAIGIIEAVAEIAKQLIGGVSDVHNAYGVAVTAQGNKKAQQIVCEVFEPGDGFWRGLGKIPQSTLVLRDEYKKFDALEKFGLEDIEGTDNSGCRCGEVLCGLIDPPQCHLFASVCNPDTPVGPCMVSSEGACSAWYKYSGRH